MVKEFKQLEIAIATMIAISIAVAAFAIMVGILVGNFGSDCDCCAARTTSTFVHSIISVSHKTASRKLTLPFLTDWPEAAASTAAASTTATAVDLFQRKQEQCLENSTLILLILILHFTSVSEHCT